MMLTRALPVAATLLGVALACEGTVADTAPKITEVSVVPGDIRSGEHVTATVLTAGDAVSVVAHVARREIVIPRVSDGVFSGSAVVPHIPRFLHFHVNVTFVARGPHGNSDAQTTSVKVN
jgi:hypothetical protein